LVYILSGLSITINGQRTTDIGQLFLLIIVNIDYICIIKSAGKVIVEINNICYAIDREEWRKWLEMNYESSASVWLVFYKKHTGKPTVTYNEAVEEALCFGWIDSTVKTIDDEKYCQKFTPRKKNSKWSESNIARVKMLIDNGRMTDAGLAKFTVETVEKTSSLNAISQQQDMIDPLFESELQKNPAALEYFYNLAPSHKKNFIRWINAAKRLETKIKRIKESLELLENYHKLGMK
jgi:uncharacterized protein YdeI (YjbR/CyaY-like superfamily)